MKTAVEWLVYVVQSNIAPNYIPKEIVKQAKEMEKQQIENAYWNGGQDVPLTEKRCEEYYKETFKNK